MEDKNIFSKFTLETQAKYKNTKIQISLQGLLPWACWKIYSAKMSYCQNSDIREVRVLSTANNRDIHYSS